MNKYAIFIHGVRGGTIEFNDTEYGRELKCLLEEQGCSVKPLEETRRISNGSRNTVGGEVIRRMIANYERQK